MRRATTISALIAATTLQACVSAPLGVAATPTTTASQDLPPARLRYYSKSETGRCHEGPGGPAFIPAPVTLFLLTAGWNVLQGELQRRAKAEADRYTATYAGRTNVTTSSDAIACIEFTRFDDRGEALTLWFEISPLGAGDVGVAPSPPAVVVRPAGIDFQRAVARTRGEKPKMNLAISIAFSAVVQGERGPELKTFAPVTFTYDKVELGARRTGFTGQASAVMAPLPSGVASTIAIGVTEKGPGGERYTDVAGALEASKDAFEGLISGYFGD